MSLIGFDLPGSGVVVPAERGHLGLARRHRRHVAVGDRAGPHRRRASPAGRGHARRGDRAADSPGRAARHRRRIGAARHCCARSSALFGGVDSASGSSVLGAVVDLRRRRSCSARCSRVRELGARRADRAASRGSPARSLARTRRAIRSARRQRRPRSMIGVALVGFITIFAASAKPSVTRRGRRPVQDRLHHQQRRGFGGAGLSPTARRERSRRCRRSQAVDPVARRQCGVNEHVDVHHGGRPARRRRQLFDFADVAGGSSPTSRRRHRDLEEEGRRASLEDRRARSR